MGLKVISGGRFALVNQVSAENYWTQAQVHNPSPGVFSLCGDLKPTTLSG